MKNLYRNGDSSYNNGLNLPVGHLSVDSEKKALRLYDGGTQGGFECLGERAYETPLGPGPKELIAGDGNIGFYGELTKDELLSGEELSMEIGLSEGIPNVGPLTWFKFSYYGTILFVPKFQLRHSLSWDTLDSKGVVNGETTIIINQSILKVRLLEGLNPGGSKPTVPNNGAINPSFTHESEWNRLIYSVASTQFTSETIDKFLRIPEGDLLLTNSTGSANWCRETFTGDAIIRGTSINIGDIRLRPTSNNQNYYGWRPVLELIP